MDASERMQVDEHAPSSTAPEQAKPVIGRSPSALRTRLWAAGVFAACATLIGMAVYMRPDSRGYGTHQQLGMAPCGMILRTGYPCPTCGMTTAFSYAVRGNLVGAFLAQPSGLLMALATLAAGAISGWTLIAGRWPLRRRFDPSPHLLFWGMLLLLLGGWGFKLLLGLADGSLPVRIVRISP